MRRLGYDWGMEDSLYRVMAVLTVLFTAVLVIVLGSERIGVLFPITGSMVAAVVIFRIVREINRCNDPPKHAPPDPPSYPPAK